MYELLARTLRGIEWIAAAEIRAVLGVSEIARGHRELRFRLPELSPQSLDLGTVDDVFLVAAVVDGIGRARAGLTRLTGAATAVDLDALAEVVSRVRDVSDRSCDVVGSFLGRRNFSRYELEDAVGAALATAGGWAYRSRSAGAPARGSLSVRVHLEGTRAAMAVRIAAAPLHRRTYRTSSRPGSLHPPPARALALLVGLRPGACLVDPFCGAGTIPIEAKLACCSVRAAGSDLDQRALPIARRNAEAAAAEVDIVCADAARLPQADESVDRIATNPPWGSSVERAGLAADPDSFGRELRRVLTPDGRIVLLTPLHISLDRVARTELELLLEERVRVSGALVTLRFLARPGNH